MESLYKTILISLFCFCATIGFAQFETDSLYYYSDSSYTLEEEVKYELQLNIHQDSLIGKTLELHKKFNELDHRIEGYRIQIFFESGNNSKNLATECKDAFYELFPEISAYISFKEPFYRVRIGDFITKFEADQQLKLIKKEYPNAWVIKDKINYPRIMEENTEEVEETEEVFE